MKKSMIVLALLVVAGACRPATQQAKLESDDQKTAYALGYRLGQNLKPLKLPADEVAAVRSGLEDGALGHESQVDMRTYEPGVQKLVQKRASAVAAARRESEQAYLKKVMEEKGAKHYDSGLIMIQTKEGTGPTPKVTDRVKVNYNGTLSNGSVFDSSIARGEPAVFPLNGVIPCWTEALQKMKVGGKAKVICPSKLAYGDTGRPPHIPPGASLTFDVELLGIVK